MKLLIDLGNSHLKWTTAIGSQLAPMQRLDYRVENAWSLLSASWSVLPKPTRIIIASVGQIAIRQQVQDVLMQLWPQSVVEMPRAVAQCAGVHNAYRDPSALGVDRWLALLAAHHVYRGNSCVVDCGTAITLDQMNADGRHLGGLIMPGLQLMRQSLSSNTAALPLANADETVLLADHTAAGIASGCCWAAVGLIEVVLNRSPDRVQLILTGGNAPQVHALLHCPAILDSTLVFKGLLCYADHHSNQS